MPVARSNPLSIPLMVITKDDELETAGIHDTPIHVKWSAQGNMAIAVGSAYRIFSSVRSGEVIPEPWSIQYTVVPEGINSTGFGPSPIEVSRGRSPRQSLPQPSFGRGDEDGFPALTSARPSPKPSPRFKPSPLPSSKPKEGTASPAHRSVPASPYLKGNVELPSSPGPASLAPPSPASGSRNTAGASKTPERNTSSSRVRHASGRHSRRAIDRTQALVDEDISMIMRRRVINGYGLSHVRFMAIESNNPVSYRASKW
jgi:SEA/GATOR complex protein SEA4/MIOS